MKKTVLLLTASFLLTAGLAMGQTASIAFNDNGLGGGTATTGTYSPTDTFNFDVFLTFDGGTGGTAQGLSLWLQTNSSIAPSINITGETLFTFLIAQDGEAKPWTFTDTASADAGFKSDQSATQTGDLGATTTSNFPTNGTYKVSNIVFGFTGLAPGNYQIRSTIGGVKPSEATVNSTDAFFGQSVYNFTIVPEPATWSLFGLGGLGTLGLTWLRARKRI